MSSLQDVNSALRIHFRECFIDITHSAEIPRSIAEQALLHRPFLEWVQKCRDSNLVIHDLYIQSVDMFGPKVGFIKFRTSVTANGVTKTHIVFLRSDAVGVLVVLICNGVRYLVLTRQARVPTGSSNFLEIPAGMMDTSGDVVGVALDELEQETGITLNSDQLSKLVPIVPSAGGTCEVVYLFSCEIECTKEKLEEFQGKLTGLIKEGEVITLQVLSLEDTNKMIDEGNQPIDGKLLAALRAYERKLEAAVKSVSQSKGAGSGESCDN